MNYLMEEHLIEEHRKDIKQDMHDIRQQEKALQGKVFRPNWFTRAMQGFGLWLIQRGEKLVKRYETPQKSRQRPASYAH